MIKKSLRSFNPKRVAILETQMWQAYYHHHFLKLFFLLVKLMREFFGSNFISALHAAFFSTLAAVDFRINKGKENNERITKYLVKFFQIIQKQSIEGFDPHKAAEKELSWWLVDRYPERYEISREESLARAMSVVYSVDSSHLKEYAQHRAEAMGLQDEFERGGDQVDWEKVELLLVRSFESLRQAVL